MKQEFIDKIRQQLNEDEYLFLEPMSKHTTFEIGGPADIYLTPHLAHAAEVLKLCKEFEVPMTFVGNGSNMLVGDKGIRGAVIALNQNIADIEILDENCIRAGAGAKLCDVAEFTAQHALSGFEFASGIPGSVGGAIYMNAGAYGGEIKNIVKSVKVLTKDGEMKLLSLEEMKFSYRHSCIQENGSLVLEVIFQLHEGDINQIREQIHELTQKREEKQPLEYPSAGSTFKRPEGYFAGKLIMDSGLRGFRVGGAQISEKHCGFVINRDHATAEDVCNLIGEVIKVVKEKQNVTLEPEVKRIGEF